MSLQKNWHTALPVLVCGKLFENLQLIFSYYLNRKLGRWLLEIFNKGKRSKTLEYFKSTSLSS